MFSGPGARAQNLARLVFSEGQAKRSSTPKYFWDEELLVAKKFLGRGASSQKISRQTVFKNGLQTGVCFWGTRTAPATQLCSRTLLFWSSSQKWWTSPKHILFKRTVGALVPKIKMGRGSSSLKYFWDEELLVPKIFLGRGASSHFFGGGRGQQQCV